ncbi:hypothetical protein UA08_03064 [Talaromyces atroroseus]|uniref:Xylanolytic transcriptional activator regulatory domain-containing protein n=1 Tax=Talaromyces atroroseus TaxID=1441469 RepID=A0A225B729_TALAT|nr:hypothetical protein UA08_03064 [Talaromyces atroroseus]OKL61727.1 hypothetical protein UA08_03064 [Talaromyces atroroseus]
MAADSGRQRAPQAAHACVICQFVDDISTRYFRSFHLHLPIISRTRFYNNLITLGTARAADFSVLLLTICLITHAPALGYEHSHEAPRPVEQQTLYLIARSLFAQVQVSCPPSVPLVQTSLLLAMYEYTHGRPDDAFVTIAGSARMAYAARIHARDRHKAQMTHIAGKNTNSDLLLQAEEAANTWWAIVIFERTFFSEVACIDQPLVTVFPGGDARLPFDLQVFDQLDVLDPRLDTNIQNFLSLVMPNTVGQLGVYCAAISISIRSQEALDTVTKVVVDIAESVILGFPANTATSVIDAMPPMFPYITRAALTHINNRVQNENTSWLRSDEDVLQTAINKYFQRWNVNTD